MKSTKRWLAAMVACASLWVPAAGSSAQQDPRMFFEVGDLATATGRGDVLIRFRPRSLQLRTTRVELDTRLTPKGITSNKRCEKIAIANAHNVIVHDIWMQTTEIIDRPEFGEIADVQYDWDCNLIIADMGGNAIGAPKPKDGVLWLLTPEGELRRIGIRRRWSNPAFLEMDEWGTLFVIDKGSGQKIPGSGGWHYDTIYKLGPPRYTHAVAKFKRKGLDATSFTMHPDGRFFIGNRDQLLVLQDDQLYDYCPGARFNRVNGLALTSDLELFLLDGYDVFGDSFLYRVDPGCDLRLIETGAKIDGAQGLTAGLPAR